ncbi:hypothetical protein [uncultured Limosilactobacillus sp.]|uniref:hypothetical protein n=1 Tax=uncultured Limosilactobacillus sp. TaxID=2837629 RepID=UPI0025F2FEBE|nr:hypothetical protein [uncultured Limosilactobacillus sp.]
MDKSEAKELYHAVRNGASFIGNRIIFNDDKQMIFIKHLLWSKCRMYHYSDIETDYIYQQSGTINKGHPYFGAIAGRTLTNGSFMGGMVGAIAGQNTPGKQQNYVVDPMLVMVFKDGYQYQEILDHGVIKDHTIYGWLNQQYTQKLQDQLDRADGTAKFRETGRLH